MTISFVTTFVILVTILLGTYAFIYLNQVPVRHLPQGVPVYDAVWAKYVPQGALQVGFQNFTLLRELNSSLPFPATALHTLIPNLVITTSNMTYFETIVFKTPNATVDIAFLKSSAYLVFASKFSDLGQPAATVGENSLYAIADIATGKQVLGWLALLPRDRAISFAPAAGNSTGALNDAKQATVTALGVPSHNSSIIHSLDVRQMLYVAGGANGHISLGIQGFSGEIASSLKTLTTVDVQGSRINVTRTVGFENSSASYSNYSTVKKTYLKATNVIVYDMFVRASQLDALSKLGGDYRLVL